MTPFPPTPEPQEPRAGDVEHPWLVMLYLAGDNNLTEDMVAALQDLQRGRPLTGDRIVAQLDPSAMGIATQRYDFNARTSGDGTKIEHFRASSLPETNTGNIDALVNFIQWAHTTSGSNGTEFRHLLILSGHGSGTTEDFLLRDENSWDALSIDELAAALRLAHVALGKKIDILGMDACFMSMFEVAYEICEDVDVLVGAEGLEPEFGWPYSRILARARQARELYKRPMEPRELAEAIVQEYVEYYSDYDRAAGRSADLAAIDLSKMDDLGDAINALAHSLIDAADADRVTLAHWDAQTYKADQFVDLHDFSIQTYKRFCGHEAVRLACRKVVRVLDGTEKVFEAVEKDLQLTTDEVDGRCIIRSGCSGFAHQHSYGMSIYFPWADVSPDYENLTFSGGLDLRPRDATRRLVGSSPSTGSWLQFLKKQVTTTRRKPRFNDRVTSALPSDADLADSLASIEMRRIEELLSTYADVQPAGMAEVKRELAKALERKIGRKRIKLVETNVSVEDRLDRLLAVTNCFGPRNSGSPERSRYGPRSRYAPRSRYGPRSRYSDGRDTWIKNLPPVIGKAYWPKSRTPYEQPLLPDAVGAAI